MGASLRYEGIGTPSTVLQRRSFLMGAIASIPLLQGCASLRRKHDLLVLDPGRRTPETVGLQVALHFAAKPLLIPIEMDGKLVRLDHIHYWESCAWYGALRVAAQLRSRRLLAALESRGKSLFGVDASKIPPGTADQVLSFHGGPVFGIVMFASYRLTGDRRALRTGIELADLQWLRPEEKAIAWTDDERRALIRDTMDQGLSWQTRFWIDDAYLIVMLQVEAYRATGKRIYIDRAAHEMQAHLERLQQPNGLFHHGPNAHFFWGRGNGWVAAGLSELLNSLPPDHPRRPFLLERYQRMMTTLLSYQDRNGLWHQLIDYPEAWAETSASAMFTFAFASGIRAGILDEAIFKPAVQRGWTGLLSQVSDTGIVSGVCEGSNKSNEASYYLKRRRNTDDPHGIAAVLWCAAALVNT